MWKVLLYVESEIDSEKSLKKWIENQRKKKIDGIICQEVGKPLTEGSIRVAVGKVRAELEECLMIVADDEEWELAQSMNLAALPYANPKLSRQAFHGAWLVIEGFDEISDEFFLRVYQRHHRIPWTLITTERCIIRELALTDLDELFEIYEQDGVTEFVEPLYPREKELEYQSAYIENMYRYYGYGMWLVCSRKSGKIIGRAGVEHRTYPAGTELEMGYLIVPVEQKKGYAEEVCRAMIGFVRRELDFTRINCLIHRENTVSIHLVEKLGFFYMEDTWITGELMCRYVLELC